MKNEEINSQAVDQDKETHCRYGHQSGSDENSQIKHDEDVVGEEPCAWLSIQERGDSLFLVKEFGYDTNLFDYEDDQPSTHVQWMFGLLLSRALNEESAGELVDLKIPSAVLKRLRAVLGEQQGSEENFNSVSNDYFVWESIRADDDLGWMYKRLDIDHPGGEDEDENLVNDSVGKVDKEKDFQFLLPSDKKDQTRPHLIWPADSF